jgi:hypothetical protein
MPKKTQVTTRAEHELTQAQVAAASAVPTPAKRSFKEALLAMPNVGDDALFARARRSRAR